MIETFFGPWRVLLDSPAHNIEQSFTISGSDSADGRYSAAAAPEPWDLTVGGSEWRIILETYDDAEERWHPADGRREMSVEPPRGLAVILDTRNPLSDLVYGMRLICISLDPEINPPPTDNPYDFTYSG